MIVLSVLVLITITVLAFFTRATSNRTVEISRSGRTEATLLGQTAGDYVVAKFMEEIVDPANNSGTNDVYFPKSAANAIPRRLVEASLEADVNFGDLLRQSLPTVDPNTSADSTDLSAKNGRRIDVKRWNAPQLIAGNGFSSASQLPHWIYVDPKGPATAISPKVTGRFAYNVYQVGGLLNTNVAGFPSGATADALKGTAAGVDFTKLAAISQVNVDKLVRFRNPSSIAYGNQVAAGARKGFLSIVTDDGGNLIKNNYFTSRQDLLRYVSSENPGLADALPYLTHFSLSANAPSWAPAFNSPSASYAYRDNASHPTSVNRSLPDVRFDDSFSIKHYDDDAKEQTYAVKKGSPLLQRRFSLSKLAWITYNGPRNGVAAEPIQSCFGLQWDASKYRWNYVGNSGATAQKSIKTLKDVASEGREPNFFELLKAVILQGSLGLNWNFKHTVPVDNSLGAQDRQIIQIGVNIIDQARADNYPTAIYFPSNTTTLTAAFDQDVYNTLIGIKDLPYLNQMDTITFEYENGAFGGWLQPEFWNPHRALGTVVPSPSQFRIRAYGTGWYTSVEQWAQLAGSATENYKPQIKTPLQDYKGGSQAQDSIYFNVPATVRDHPTRLTLVDVDAVNTDARHLFKKTWNAASWDSGTVVPNEFAGFSAGMAPTTSAVKRDGLEPNSKFSFWTYIYFGDSGSGTNASTFVVDYKAPDGSWRPYTSILRMTYGGDSFNSYRRGFYEVDAAGKAPALPRGRIGTTYGDASFAKADPRTDRFSIAKGFTPTYSGLAAPEKNNGQTLFLPESTFQPSAAQVNTTVKNNGPNNANYFSYSDNTALGGWMNNLSSSTARYKDADGIMRPGDAWKQNGPALLYHGALGASHRPVVLNRPFQSVGELGYVFRDLPFKSVDFWSDDSADAALLDAFCVYDAPDVIAGEVDINTAPAAVLKGIFVGKEKSIGGAVVIEGEAEALAQALIDRRPFLNRADLVNTLCTAWVNAFPQADKADGEAPVRALASFADTRTWNLLIDVIAQSGRTPKSAQTGATGADFNVTGECRYWLHVAIDRYTGKIVGQQLESVTE